jgi:phospholipase A1/A2
VPRRIEAGVLAATHTPGRRRCNAAILANALLLASVPPMAVLAAEPADDARNGVGRPREQAVEVSVSQIPAPTSAPVSPFSTYRANYLIIGPENSPMVDNPTSKFQLSLKYDTGASWYFAYTQRGYWDIAADSSPLFDQSIEPGVFYFWKPKAEMAARWHIVSARTGFVHESNGKEDTSSRAWSRTYVEPLFRWQEFFFEPKLWVITATDDQNKDIKDYYGYADIVFGVETATRQRFTVTGRQGLKHGSLQVDVSLPANSLFTGNTMRPYLYAQLWTGYGETLLYYNVRTTAFRIGIEFHP